MPQDTHAVFAEFAPLPAGQFVQLVAYLPTGTTVPDVHEVVGPEVLEHSVPPGQLLHDAAPSIVV